MIEFLGAVATVLAIIGVWYNNRKMIRCFYFWIVSNSLSLLIHWQAGISSLASRDCLFALMAIAGIWQWRHGMTDDGRRARDAEVIKRLKQDNDALEAMVAAFEVQGNKSKRVKEEKRK